MFLGSITHYTKLWCIAGLHRTVKNQAYICEKTGSHGKFTKSMTPELSPWHIVSYIDIEMTKRAHVFPMVKKDKA